MKLQLQPIIQVAIWGIILSAFFYADHNTNMPDNFFWLSIIRVVSFAIYFNVIYYWLLPMYFSGGHRKSFFAGSVAVFLIFVWCASTVDSYFMSNFSPNSGNIPPLPTMSKPINPNMEMEPPRAIKPGGPRHLIAIPAIFLGLILFGAAASIRGFSAFEQKKRAEEEANHRRIEAELALLKTQINPHFLLNTLNNLYGISITEPEKTSEALLKLSDMVRYLLYECTQPRVPLEHDLDFVTNYLSLQQLRLPPNATLTVQLPEQIPNKQIEPMLLIPFIENAFKHGLTTKQACQISVQITTTSESIILKVENPVFPAKSDDQKTASGIGLNNTIQRLQHGYPNRHHLDISNDGAVYIVHLELNL